MIDMPLLSALGHVGASTLFSPIFPPCFYLDDFLFAIIASFIFMFTVICEYTSQCFHVAF